MTSRDEETPTPRSLIALPPMPLATGIYANDAGGVAQPVSDVEVVITLRTGETVTIALEHSRGAWWPPGVIPPDEELAP